MQFKDYYEILGLQRSATQDEIKRAYRKLARKYHPDVSKEADTEARFKEVGEAYEVLKDPEKRAAYDRMGANWKNGQDFQPPPNWDAGFEFSGRGADAGPGDGYFNGGASDFFEALFGAQARRARQRAAHAQGEDHHAKVLIDLRDAYTGARRSISLRLPVVDDQGHVSTRERTLEVGIPKGIREGQHLRLSGQGAPGMGQGRAGDLYLEIGFAPNARFRVDGADVYMDLPLAPWEAALGTKLTAPTPDGSVQLTIPSGSSAGRKLRLKGRGIPSNNPSNAAGDLYLVLTISLPPAQTEAAKEAYRAMAGKFDFNPRAEMEGTRS